MTFRIATLSVLLVAATLSNGASTRAQEPTPTTPVFDLDLTISGTTFSWNVAPNVSEYTLAGTALATVFNRDQPCNTPSVGLQTIQINERLPGDTTQFSLTLPTLMPGEEWRVTPSPVDLFALGAGGESIAADRIFIVGDGGLEPSACATAVPSTPVPAQTTTLPRTGTGPDEQAGAFHTVALLLAAWSTAVLFVASIASRRV